jgi:hypothetical protein
MSDLEARIAGMNTRLRWAAEDLETEKQENDRLAIELEETYAELSALYNGLEYLIVKHTRYISSTGIPRGMIRVEDVHNLLASCQKRGENDTLLTVPDDNH